MPKPNKPEETKESYGTGKYGKKNIWKWVVIYIIAAVVIYAIIYFLVINKGSSPYGY